VWPALARALAVRRPKPIDAPDDDNFLGHGRFLSISKCFVDSGDAAIGAQRLAVDPTSVGADEERHSRGDIFRCSQPLHRRHFGQVIDLLLGLAGQKEVRRGRSRCDGIDGDVASPKFLGEDEGQRLDRRFRGSVYRVARAQATR